MGDPEELIVLMNDAGEEIGTAPKLQSHHADTPLHKAFSCYIFNGDNKVLVAQRAASKKVWPGVWSNSMCGHPAPGESQEAAMQRRAREELGMEITAISLILPNYRYRTPPFNGVIENEVCPVYAARAGGEVNPNPEEVGDFTWMAWDDYARELLLQPAEYSYWAKDQIRQLVNSKTLQQFLLSEAE